MPKPSTQRADIQDRGRFSARPKADAVVRLPRGEGLGTLSREPGVTAATLSGWRDGLLDGGSAALKSRPAGHRGEEVARLRSKVGQLTIDNERLSQGCQRMESGRPPAARRRGG